MKSEFVAPELAGREAEWLRELLANIPLWGRPTLAVFLHCDNQILIAVANNTVYNEQRRHIHLRYIIVRNLNKNGLMSLVHCV